MGDLSKAIWNVEFSILSRDVAFAKDVSCTLLFRPVVTEGGLLPCCERIKSMFVSTVASEQHGAWSFGSTCKDEPVLTDLLGRNSDDKKLR